MSNPSHLIQRWLDGDERAAEGLYNHYRETVFRFACGLLDNPADAEEVAQDVLVYALTHIGDYDPGRASIKTWLYTITISRCRDRQRRRRLPTLSLTTWLQWGRKLPDPAPIPESHAIRLETRSEVWSAVQALKPPLREAIILRYWAGCTYQEMAEIVGCPMRTAQSRVRLAYRQLRIRLAPAQAVNAFEEKVI